MNITITVEGPVYITMQPSGSSSTPLGGSIGQIQLKEIPPVALEQTMNNEQRVMLSIDPKTESGQAAQIDGEPLWEVESGTGTLEDLTPPDPKRRYAYPDGAFVGDFVVHCTADADLGEGAVNLVEAFILHIEHPMATSMGGSIGEPELKPTA